MVADRGTARNFSAGLRASKSLPWADLYGAGGSSGTRPWPWRGSRPLVGSWKLRAEGVLPYNLDQDELKRPRVTLGVDWLGGETLVSAEYHFNGIGALHPQGYAAVLQDAPFSRGESYYLGRDYLGGLATWTPGNDRLSLSVTGLANLRDGSWAFTPVCTYDFGQDTRASLGGLVTLGQTPYLSSNPGAPIPSLAFRSEYGSYGDLFFTRISVYF